jgi:anti-anti-sigma regulatory factor
LRAEVIRVSLPQSVPAASPHGDPSSFRIRIDLIGCRVQLAGQLDRRTVHLLHDAISSLLVTDGDVWVVDATDVTSCDRMGVCGIGVTYRRALRHGRRVKLIGAPPSLHRELTRLRLDHHLLDRGDALTAVPDNEKA